MKKVEFYTIPKGKFSGGNPNVTILADGKSVGAIRKAPTGWFLRINGHQWKVNEIDTPGMDRINKIVPGDKVTDIPVRFFKKITDARKEAIKVINGGNDA